MVNHAPTASTYIMGRLYNYKFKQAYDMLTGDEPEEVRILLKALKDSFGNLGWFDGHMAVLADCACRRIAELLGHTWGSGGI